jgi:hypothetical protein
MEGSSEVRTGPGDSRSSTAGISGSSRSAPSSAVVSLVVGVRYFFKAFPEAQIEFKTTKQTSLPIAKTFLARLDLPTRGYRHASVFGFDDDAKTFLERELGAEESGRLLDGPVRMWRWQHRWFRPLQKEELQVEVTTRGEVAAFRHLLKEEDPGASLPAEEAAGSPRPS